MSDYSELAELAEYAASIGGLIVADAFGAPREFSAKGPGDWVSEIDLRSEEAIRTVLESSGLPVFGEEAGGERSALGWLVDPLDGTTNFLRGIAAVGVSVGLVADGVPVAGAVYAPMLSEMYTASFGDGAYRNSERIGVAARDVAHAITATGLPFRRKARLDEYWPFFRAAFAALEDVRRIGAASLDLAWTAAGVVDGYFELSLGPWDVAAGACIVREAGGIVTDWHGDANAWLNSGDVIAASPPVHAALLAIAEDARA
ncbi:MAG: inositol monophosphatase family protein [Acidimicrobiia bacterium]